MDLAHRTRTVVQERTAPMAHVEQEDNDNDERDSYELSFEDEQDIIDDSNDEGDDDDDDENEESGSAREPTEWKAITTTTTTTTVTVADKQKFGDNQAESSFKQVSAFLTTERRKVNAEKLEITSTAAAISSDIDPGAGGDSLSAVYGNTDDEDEDDDADGMRMAQNSAPATRSGSTTDVSICYESAALTGDRDIKQYRSETNKTLTSLQQDENASENNTADSADEPENISHRDGDDHENQDNEYSDLTFLQSTDDEQSAVARTASGKGSEPAKAKPVSAEKNAEASSFVRNASGANADSRSFLDNKPARKTCENIADAASDKSSPPDNSSRLDIEPKYNTRTVTPTNFSVMMRRRSVTAAEAEQQQQQQQEKSQHYSTANENRADASRKTLDQNGMNKRGSNEQVHKLSLSASSNTDRRDDRKKARRKASPIISKKNSATFDSVSAKPAAASDNTNAQRDDMEMDDRSENLLLSPNTKMFAKHEQKSFSKVAADLHSIEYDDDGNLSEASTTTMPIDSNQSGGQAVSVSAAASVALTPKASLFRQQLLQNIDESDYDGASSVSDNNNHQQKTSVPLHAVKSRRVQQPGAPDSALSSNDNTSRATTSSSRKSATHKKLSTNGDKADETNSAGGDLYRQFKKLQNQYKSLQTRIQSGIKQHLQQAPGMAEELDDLDVYKRGLYDKREHDRAQRLTLLEKLKVELGKATTAIDRLQQAPRDTLAKDAAKSALSTLAQKLTDAREMYRSLDVALSDQAKTSTNELKQVQDRLGTYMKRIAQDVTQQEQQQQNIINKANDRKPVTATTAKQEKKTKAKTDSAETRHQPSAQTIVSASAGSIVHEKFGHTKKLGHTASTSGANGSTARRPRLRSDATDKRRNADEDTSKSKSAVAPQKSRIQTRLAKGDLPDAVFEYRSFLEHNGGRNGVGWTELEHKAFLAARAKQRAFAPAHTGGDGDASADPSNAMQDEENLYAMPINDERFYSDLAKELMIKTPQQVREHDEWYAHVQRLDAAQKQAVKAQKDAKRLRREQKQKQLKEQQARQRLMAQKLREQAMKKWHEQTKHQVEKWKARKSEQDKQKEDEKKLEQLVKKERQTKMRQKHELIKQKVLEYREQKEKEAAEERERQEQEELEERRQRALEANKFLKVSANKSIQGVQQQRQRSKKFVEQQRVEKEERLQRLRNKVSVNVERDPQRLLEQTTAWKRRTTAGAAATVRNPNSVAAKDKKNSTAANRSGGGGGDAERKNTAASASESESEASSSSDSSSEDDDEDESEEEEQQDKKEKKPVVSKALPSPPQRRSNVTLQKPTKSQPVMPSPAAVPERKVGVRPFVAGGLVKKTTVTTTRTSTIKLA